MRASTNLCKANCIIVDSEDPGKLRCSVCDRRMCNTSYNVNRHIEGSEHRKWLEERAKSETNATKDKTHIRKYIKKEKDPRLELKWTYGHTRVRAPLPVRSAKLSTLGPS